MTSDYSVADLGFVQFSYPAKTPFDFRWPAWVDDLTRYVYDPCYRIAEIAKRPED